MLCGNHVWVQVVTGSNETLDVASMAELLFGEATTAHKYAAHRLLSEDRTYFKQTNRSPARFQPRPETEVRSLIMKAEAAAKVGPAAGLSGFPACQCKGSAICHVSAFLHSLQASDSSVTSLIDSCRPHVLELQMGLSLSIGQCHSCPHLSGYRHTSLQDWDSSD